MAIEERLPEPYEILDLPDGGIAEMRVFGWRRGTMDIVDRATGESKTIPALRVIVDPAQKKTGPAYWDVTSKLLQAQLLELFKMPQLTSYVFTVQKHGIAPSARFSVGVVKR